jgi:hypothetical protein
MNKELLEQLKNELNQGTDKRPSTIFLDIDGSILKHFGSPDLIFVQQPILSGVIDKFREWDAKGFKIILTTGRKESLREITEKQLKFHGLFWDVLIMGLGGGVRYLINDLKPNSNLATAVAVNLKRDGGLSRLDLETERLNQSLLVNGS